MREGEAHAARAPREQVQGGEDLLIEPVVRVELLPNRPRSCLSSPPVQPVVVLRSSSSLTIPPLPAFALLLGGAASASFPLFSFSAHRARARGGRSSAPAARSTAGGSMGTAVTASDVSSGRSLTDSVASNEPPSPRRRNNEKPSERMRASQQRVSPGSKPRFFTQPIWWGWLLAHGGMPSSRCAATRDRRENPTERELSTKPTTAPRRPGETLPTSPTAVPSSGSPPGWSLRFPSPSDCAPEMIAPSRDRVENSLFRSDSPSTTDRYFIRRPARGTAVPAGAGAMSIAFGGVRARRCSTCDDETRRTPKRDREAPLPASSSPRRAVRTAETSRRRPRPPPPRPLPTPRRPVPCTSSTPTRTKSSTTATISSSCGAPGRRTCSEEAWPRRCAITGAPFDPTAAGWDHLDVVAIDDCVFARARCSATTSSCAPPCEASAKRRWRCDRRWCSRTAASSLAATATVAPTSATGRRRRFRARFAAGGRATGTGATGATGATWGRCEDPGGCTGVGVGRGRGGRRADVEASADPRADRRRRRRG